MIITEHWCHGGHMTKDLENHGTGPSVSTLSQLAKKPWHKKMGRLATGDDGSMRWMRILKRMTANLRLKGSGWLSKAEAPVPGNGWSGHSKEDTQKP